MSDDHYITYHPYFDEWEGWMDGYYVITDGEGHTISQDDLDFVSTGEYQPGADSVIIQPFTAKSAEIYLAVKFSIPVERVTIESHDDVF